MNRPKNKADELREEYHRKLGELQESCPHTSLTEWQETMWAAGHFNDYESQFCLDCNKEVHVKHQCRLCGKALIDGEAKDGDGKRFPIGSAYCAECLSKPPSIDTPKGLNVGKLALLLFVACALAGILVYLLR